MKSFSFTALILAVYCTQIWAAGISVDAGLTPPLDRWIFRTQLRMGGRDNPPGTPASMAMDSRVIPMVLVYGLRSHLTIMVKQAVMRKEMGQLEQTGMSDLFFMTKFKAYRINTRHYTLGVSPILGIEFPTGSDAMSSHTWDMALGVYLTARERFWSQDLNFSYRINGVDGNNPQDVEPGDEVAIDIAAGRQIGLDETFNNTFAPVLELSYHKIFSSRFNGSNLPNTGESILLLSPGFKFTSGSLILEALYQTPVWQDQNGNLQKRRATLLIGMRLLF